MTETTIHETKDGRAVTSCQITREREVIKVAANKAYQIFIDYGLSIGEAKHAINIINAKMENTKLQQNKLSNAETIVGKSESEHLQKKKPTMEATTVLTFNSDGSTRVETFSLVQRSVIPRPRPNAFEAESPSQKSETPVAESRQNHPPVHPGSE